jgi:hypothetical protein
MRIVICVLCGLDTYAVLRPLCRATAHSSAVRHVIPHNTASRGGQNYSGRRAPTADGGHCTVGYMINDVEGDPRDLFHARRTYQHFRLWNLQQGEWR